MNKATKVMTVIFAVIIIVGGAFAWYFYNQETSFFFTDNAQITAKTITITPTGTGKLVKWDVSEGDYVDKDEVLGRQNNTAYIKTPIAGEVVRSNVVIDQVVAPGTELAIVADVANMYVKANIEETDIAAISENQIVDVSIDAYPGVKFEGYVEEINMATHQAFTGSMNMNTSGTYTKVTQLIPVKILLTNAKDYSFRLGMNATVKIHLK